MNVIIKNGTNQFHGSAYFFLRNEALDANEFFNNLSHVAKPMYRYLNPGGTFGGPLLIPGTNFNKSRTKLFFFFSEDYLRYVNPAGLSEYTMPTALERTGNFSQTTTTIGKLIPIKNPSTGAPYAGNIMPASLESPAGYALLNLFPLPFTTDPTGQRQYNTIYQFNLNDQHEDRILRVDYNVSPSTQAFVRFLNDYQSERGIGAHFGASGLWGQLPTNWGIPSAGAVATIIHTFRPNLINEVTVGVNHTHQSVSVNQAELATNQLPALKGPDGSKVTLPKIFQNNDVYDLIPNISFGTQNAQSVGQGVTSAPSFAFDNRFPFNGTDQSTNLIDNVSWIKGSHSLKFGFYFERMARNVSVYETDGPMGKYWFGSDISSSYDTGYAYSNLFLGSVQSYGEDNAKYINHARYNQIEWFGHDSWRLSRRITLDLGLRFQYPGALSSLGATLSLFDGSDYNAKQSGQLLFPALVNGQSVSINPLTGAVYQLARAGFFDPASYPANGSPYSGMMQKENQIFNNPGLVLGPRFGFAWDVLGNGKMALRGGFGIFYDRAMNVDYNAATSAGVGPLTAPPAFQTPTYYNTTFAQLSNAQGFLGPQSVFAGPNYKTPATYNWSFGIQRDLGKGLILDAAYVGNVVHHTFEQVDSNGVAPYSDWTPTAGANPAYLDPTSGGKAFYIANLLRPRAGYGSIFDSCGCGESKYDSLQTQVNKRFGHRWQFGANWTWSKTMSYGTRSPWAPDYLQYAEVSGDRPQVVNVNYSYRIPDGSRIWKNQFTEIMLDGWHFNGITKLLSGNPLTVTCSATGAPIGYWTGTPTGGIPFRCQMGNAGVFLPTGSALPANAPSGRYYPINVANFALPPATSLGIGNTPPTLFFGPGYEKFDFTLFKDIRLGSESRVLEIRAEAYNVFNHFNPGNPNTSLTINFATGANTNANLGTVSTAASQARHMALAMKFRF